MEIICNSKRTKRKKCNNFVYKTSTATSHTVTQNINMHKQQNRQKYISDGIFSSQDAKLDF